MTNKILIYQDKNAATSFAKEVAEVCESLNSLVSLFQAFQPWQKITTLDLFNSLVSDPAKFYDDTLLQNVKVQAAGVKPNPEKLAELIGLHRAEYLNAVAGLPLTSDDCKPCQQVKVKPGKSAISKRAFDEYEQYLIFNSGTFSVDQPKVDADIDKFNTYAVSDDEIMIYEMFTTLMDKLNSHTAKYPINSNDRMTIARAFHLQLTRGSEGDFRLNDEYLRNEIIYIKSKS